jgi:branched-chain amino acid transport system ATP-binding protein
VTILALRDVSVRLGGLHILQGVSFEVPPSGVTVLLGRNGVGKTTSLRAILGLAPAAGAIAFQGEPLGKRPTHERVQSGLGYVPEDRCVFAGLTVAENLRLAALHELTTTSCTSCSPRCCNGKDSSRGRCRAGSSRCSP